MKESPLSLQEQNRVIAEFMDYTNNYWYQNNELSYHKSWDALMPVVEKIESSGKFYVDIRTTATIIRDMNDSIVALHDFGEKTRLEHTFKAVVQFIKWYNSQKS